MNEITFSSQDDNGLQIIDNKEEKKVFLRIHKYLDGIKFPLSISYKGKTKDFTYSYKVQYPLSLDISKKMKFKRLQDRPLSCESSVTADILSYLLTEDISEYDVYELIDKTFVNTLPFMFENKRFWGNPNVWFVGYIDYYGKKSDIKPTQRDMTGYWVYEKPIQKVYTEYGFETKILTWENYTAEFTPENHLTYLLKELHHWNMVQLWWDWCTIEEYDDGIIDKWEVTQKKVDTWIYAKNYCTTTKEDRTMEWYYIEDFQLKKHVWLVWEHAFYLLGYEWWVNTPSKIIVWDSDTGYHKYDTVEWMRKWKQMDYKSIVIFKK